MCQWTTGCDRLADTVDHKIPLFKGGSMWDPANHQSLCDPHHAMKSKAERAEMAAALPKRQRATERHPGLL
jgi:5-methylcytosine-specific restriction endonuclease McrA